MTRALSPEMEFRRAVAVDLLNVRGLGGLGLHQAGRDSIQNTPPLRDHGLVRRIGNAVRDVCERLLRAALKRVQRSNHFDCDVGDQGRHVVRVQGRGFRVLADRHRVFLLIDGQPQRKFAIGNQAVNDLGQHGHDLDGCHYGRPLSSISTHVDEIIGFGYRDDGSVARWRWNSATSRYEPSDGGAA